MINKPIRKFTFEAILDEYGEGIKRFILSYVKDASATDDLVQDVFLKVYLKMDTFEDRSALKTWIYRIAINRCKDYFRSWHYQKVKLTQKLDLFNLKSGETPEEFLLQKSEDLSLAREILSLNSKYREVILLYYYRDFSISEISELLQLKESTVRTRMQRARTQLKAKLGGDDLES
ncbi:MAG TPA: sigma-70 family RNA polymerase sigma factor [Bacillales bacterium]|nr:sigma-70 family RNA polymerase sigma factor [Bacillales bacterium]